MGPINLAKIKRVHQDMMRRTEQLAQDKARCDWADETTSVRLSAISRADDVMISLEAKMPMPKRAAKLAGGSPKVEPRRFDCFGKSLTVAEWAKRTGFSESTLRTRLRWGWSLEDALTLANDRKARTYSKPIPMAPCKAKRFDYQDKRSRLKELADKAGINLHTLRTRLKRGMSMDEAMAKPIQARKVRDKPIALKAEITFREQCMSLESWARSFGLSPYTVMNRLRQGWSIDAALTIPLRGAQSHNVKGGGGWDETSSDPAGTGGVGSRDTDAKQGILSS